MSILQQKYTKPRLHEETWELIKVYRRTILCRVREGVIILGKIVASELFYENLSLQLLRCLKLQHN
jgi:hypothetical protein